MPAHSKRTPEMVEAILEGMSKGQALSHACEAQGITWQTFDNWCKEDASRGDDNLTIARASARLAGFDAIATATRSIARGLDGSTADVQRDKLIIDTDLKLLAKWDPKRYGERVDHTVTARTVSEVIPADATPEQAADAYRRLIEG